MERERRKNLVFKKFFRVSDRVLFSLLVLFSILAGCTHMIVRTKEEQIPDESVAISSIARIDSILGFFFDWQFGREKIGLMPELKAEFSGKVSIPDRIFLKGTLRTGDIVEKINTYTIEGKEYTYNKETQIWEGGAKGSFPNPLENLKLILSFGEFTFIKFDKYNNSECYLFSFKPNVYFLDPIEATKPEGFFWISEKKGPPLRIKVSSERRRLNWDMRLSKFNSFANINVPFRSQKIRVSGIKNIEREVDLIMDRFIFLGYEKPDVTIEKIGDVVFSIKAERLSDSIISDILRKGKVDLYIGTWPKDPIFELKENRKLVCEKYGEGAQLFFERGIVTKPVIAVKKILSRDALHSFELKNDILGEYSIYAYLKSEGGDSLKKIVENYLDEPMVVVVDDRAVSVSLIRDTWLVENKIPIVKGLKGNESISIFTKLKNKPLEKDYDFTWD